MNRNDGQFNKMDYNNKFHYIICFDDIKTIVVLTSEINFHAMYNILLILCETINWAFAFGNNTISFYYLVLNVNTRKEREQRYQWTT